MDDSEKAGPQQDSALAIKRGEITRERWLDQTLREAEGVLSRDTYEHLLNAISFEVRRAFIERGVPLSSPLDRDLLSLVHQLRRVTEPIVPDARGLMQMEPDIEAVGIGFSLSSIAISLKRIADVLEKGNVDITAADIGVSILSY